ncbi:MAG: single-stranded-DNA-specific exonuclease RecJ [bacterium]
MAKWIFKELKELPESFPTELKTLVSKILFSRGFSSEKEILQFINPDYKTDSLSPFAFVDMEKVVERIGKARDEKENVIIFGDYDADGVTSSAILKETFDLLGIKSSVYIPNKQTEGYSLSGDAIDVFAGEKVSLIISVDCGITSIDEVEKANSFGIDVIITDHHHVPEKLPPAFAIINPHQINCGYQFENLAGVGVAFKVVQAVFERLMPDKIEFSKWMLDLVAIGTIADCVPLVGENRLFVKYGLVVLSKTRRTGLLEMFKVGNIVINELEIPDTKKVSFYIAPRINAAGRVNHASLSYNLVMEKNPILARDFALELEESNTHRQKITEVIVDEVKILAESKFKDKKFIFAESEHFQIGIVGLVAGKITQKYNKPTAIFQKNEKISKGSFRSIPQINIIETIGECSELLERFGGHSQAAGVSVANENLEKFCQKMDELISKKLGDTDLSQEHKIECELQAREVDFNLVEDLEKLKPFGEGNVEPIFVVRNLIVKEKRTIGSGNKHIKLFLTSENNSMQTLEAVSFNGHEKYLGIVQGDFIDLACNIQKDEWNGNRKIQLMVVDIKLSADNVQ